jgi:CxxC motif-containing protein
MKAIRKISVDGPFVPGWVIADNIAGTGAALVATWYV